MHKKIKCMIFYFLNKKLILSYDNVKKKKMIITDDDLFEHILHIRELIEKELQIVFENEVKYFIDMYKFYNRYKYYKEMKIIKNRIDAILRNFSNCSTNFSIQV